jgi:hypothetical protein
MNFDLNINNYTKDELREMFELPIAFDKHTFETKETKIRDNIVNNKEINKETQVNTLNFLIKARDILLNEPASHQNNSVSKVIDKLENIYNSNFQLKPSTIEYPSEHMVQDRKDRPYLSSYPSQYFPGVINPIKKKTNHLNLNIDTRFRDNYYSTSSSNFIIQLPMQINDVLSLQLSAIELPITFYTVSKQFGNNFFTIKLTDTNETQIVNIPNGNYTDIGLINVINNELSLLTGNFAKIVFLINNDSSANGSGQTMVGCDTGGPQFDFELNFQVDKYGNDDRNTPLPLKFGWILGFRNGIYTGNQNYVSEAVVNTTGPNYLYLVIDDYNNSVNNSFYSAFNSSLLNKNILARISLNSNTLTVLSQNNLSLITTPREYYGPVNIQNFNVQLLDGYGRIVDLNNMDYSFCLTMTIVYDI